ncbi:MAG: FAD-binding protein [Ruminococcaceae bacterium]|nr:FAD-binding protein [Oscillospiraceae bacterium]
MKSYTYDAIVIGTGAAGYSAACRITELGKRSVAIVTEGIHSGTSRNTGSDKQTYYKLGLGGSLPDSVRKMAETLFEGGAVDGDNALCEAALSSRCFYRLCELGVPFPHNRYGEYVGYKTDHDPYARATSAGPLTSKYMTEALEKSAKKLDIPIHDGLLAIEILKAGDSVCGLLCFDLESLELISFRCADIVLATGGPCGIYSDTVYPESHHGSTGLAVSAGAALRNMTEWQYGLASVSPRWNVSGTYMQVLPRFVSRDSDGNEYEFLAEHFADIYSALSMVFLKGYQWPFDVRKIMDGSSVIDLLVYRETVQKGRRVFLDFTKNPFGLDKIDFSRLSHEAYKYLSGANACFGTPIERLGHMNQPAIDHYKEKGVDLRSEYLEISLCAQHNNGGIAVDSHWETAIEGLFAVGECAGTHGVSRPGGSALNAGQVGALREAQRISAKKRPLASETIFERVAKEAERRNELILTRSQKRPSNAKELLEMVRKNMSASAAAIRDTEKIDKLYAEAKVLLDDFASSVGISSRADAVDLYLLRDTLTVQLLTLAAMSDYAKKNGASRGSALYTDIRGVTPEGFDGNFAFTLPKDKKHLSLIQEVLMKNGAPSVSWRSVRPIPDEDLCFEEVWRIYREDQKNME